MRLLVYLDGMKDYILASVEMDFVGMYPITLMTGISQSLVVKELCAAMSSTSQENSMQQNMLWL